MKYVVLLRGINISGKNKISMFNLKEELELLNYNTFNSNVDMEDVEEEQKYIKSDSFAFINNDLDEGYVYFKEQE